LPAARPSRNAWFRAGGGTLELRTHRLCVVLDLDEPAATDSSDWRSAYGLATPGSDRQIIIESRPTDSALAA